MTTTILSCDGDISGAVLVDSRTMRPLGLVLDDAADAERFLRWLGRDPSIMHRRDLESMIRRWRTERHWPRCSCGVNGNRVEPGHEVCCDCECDADYEAEQAAKGAA